MRTATIAASCSVLVVALTACERTERPKADSVEEVAPHVLTPRQRVSQLQAEIGVVTAIERASTAALRQVEDAGTEVSKQPPPELVTENTKKFTVFFGANNHGERNDCGCRSNPLGGLGRRHVMLRALTDERTAPEIWGDAGPAIGPVFHVDGGDSLFANNTIDRSHAEGQKVAKYDAESVMLALGTFAPDAFAVGEHDLVFGADFLRKLADKAKVPLVSANVRDAESGELLFAPSVIVDRDGTKVAFVGVTKQKTRRGEFYTERKLTVDDPHEAVKTAVAALEPHDAVVLLSNLGLVETKDLVLDLSTAGVPVELAIASSTNRMTGDPEFSGGVPVMEPLSRGKYVGRADIWLNGDETVYRNGAIATPAAMRDYRRTVRSYWTTRKSVLRERLKIAEVEMSIESIDGSQQPDTGAVREELIKRREQTIASHQKRLETYQTRLDGSAESLLKSIVRARPQTGEPTGDDWIAGLVVPVKIEIEPHPATRRVLDPREKKRPEAPAPGLPLPKP